MSLLEHRTTTSLAASLIPGLVSATFRAHSAKAVAALANRSGLRAIEWSGDFHVPPGNLKAAKEANRLAHENGLVVASYASYFHAGNGTSANKEFHTILETALELGAPLIRVWAGRTSSAGCHAHKRAQITTELTAIAEAAARCSVEIGVEFHAGTLTDTAASTRLLCQEVNHPNFSTYWQPPVGANADEAVAGLAQVAPWVSNLHVFHWWPDEMSRLPLDQGSARWRRFLRTVGGIPRRRFACLEFVPNDDPEQLAAEAATLKRWITEI